LQRAAKPLQTPLIAPVVLGHRNCPSPQRRPALRAFLFALYTRDFPRILPQTSWLQTKHITPPAGPPVLSPQPWSVTRAAACLITSRPYLDS